MRLEQASQLPQVPPSSPPEQTVDDQDMTQNPENPVEETEDHLKRNTKEDFPPVTETVKDDVDRLKVQFGGFSTRLDGFQTQLGDIEAKINRAHD